jgi:hypothetical protein
MMALSAAGPEPVVAPPPAAPAAPEPVMAPPPPPPPAPVAPMAMAALPPRTVVAAPVGRAAWAFPLGAVLVFGAIAALIVSGGR